MNLLLESSAPTSLSSSQACYSRCPWLLRKQGLSSGVDLVVEWALCSFQEVHQFVEEEILLRVQQLSSGADSAVVIVEWAVCSFQAVHYFLGKERLMW